jgi:hypothetical protein
MSETSNQDDEIYKSCPNCGKLIKWETKICPFCNSPYPEMEFQELRGGMMHPVFSENTPQTSNHKRPLSIVLLILLGIVISLVVFINIENKKSTIKAPIQSINTTTTMIATVASETTVALTTTTVEIPTTTAQSAYVFIVGDVIVSKETIITVTKFGKSTGDDFNKPKDGMEYIIVSIKIINIINDKISYNPTDFKMQNSQGQINDTAFTKVNSKTAFKSGKLVPDGEIEGTVVFEEPKNDPELTLLYLQNYFNGKEVIKISIK